MSAPIQNTPVTNDGRSFFFFSPLKRIFSFTFGPKTGCALCASSHPDPSRLAKIVGLLPVGVPVLLPAISKALGVRFGTVWNDMKFLQHTLKLPVKRTHHGLLASAPIHLCANCARLAAF